MRDEAPGLPDDLPRPVDDGAADHLRGMSVPSRPRPATGGGEVDLAERCAACTVVVFAYPRTARPGEDPLPGWDAIPGARGCTPEVCGFRDAASQFVDLGTEIYGLSTQTTASQQEAATRLGLPYQLLSDADLTFTAALRLPTFDAAGLTLLRRLTLVLRDGRVEHALYPVFPPDQAASQALSVLRTGS